MKIINESFLSHKDFNNWCQTLTEERLNNVFKIKIDNSQPDYWSIIIHKKEHFNNWTEDLILLAPLEIFDNNNDNYSLEYPQIGPIGWIKLDILEELTEEEALKEITGNINAKII